MGDGTSGSINNRLAPTSISSLGNNVANIFSGTTAVHAFGLLKNGSIYGWGFNGVN